MSRVWKKGEPVLIRCEGRAVDGTVLIASPNGRSLVLVFEAILGGHVALMPVFQGDDDVYRGLGSGVVLELEDPPERPFP
jgi:hypothetical protein